MGEWYVGVGRLSSYGKGVDTYPRLEYANPLHDSLARNMRKCRLLWNDIGSEEAEKAVLDICFGLRIEGCFPFPYSA